MYRGDDLVSSKYSSPNAGANKITADDKMAQKLGTLAPGSYTAFH